MLAFCMLAPIGDAIAKLLGSSLPIAQIVLVRFGLQALVLFVLIWATGRVWRIPGQLLPLVLLRTFLHIIGIAAMFKALQYLPLADAVAIVFVMPFFMLLLGKFVLKETVGYARLSACTVGFLGSILIIQPSFATVGWPALLPVFVAANFSAFMLVTRQIAKKVDPIGLQAVSGCFAMVMILPFVIFGQINAGEVWQSAYQNSQTVALLAAAGIVGTVAHLFMSWSLRYAPSATLAPMQYLEIPFATCLGLLIFDELPNLLAAIGILITMAAGIYIIFREQAIARSAPASAPQIAPS